MPGIAAAAGGALDLTFSGDGKTTTTPLVDIEDVARDVVVQADGKILVVGSSQDLDTNTYYTIVVRYLEDGTPDSEFGGGDGFVALPLGYSSSGNAVALLSDERIAIAGNVQVGFSDWDFAAFLLTPAGDLDSTFDGDGVSVVSFGPDIDVANGIDIDASGRIVLAGRVDETSTGMRMAVARLTLDGLPDPSFSSDGKRTIWFAGQAQASDVEIQSNGKIVLAGGRQETIGFAIARVLPGGALDTTYNGDGRTVTKSGYRANAISIQSDGKVVAAGYGLGSSIDFMLARYRLNGSLDSTFSRDGIVRTNFNGFEDIAYDVEVQPNGKILAVGYVEVNRQLRFGIVRYRPSGIRDLTFSGDGKVANVVGSAFGAALDETPRLVVVGSIGTTMGTARYLLS
jgi:uncharacterized delta-60 repeat protein